MVVGFILIPFPLLRRLISFNSIHDNLGGGRPLAGYPQPNAHGHMMRILRCRGRYSFQFFKDPTSSNSTSAPAWLSRTRDPSVRARRNSEKGEIGHAERSHSHFSVFSHSPRLAPAFPLIPMGPLGRDLCWALIQKKLLGS